MTDLYKASRAAEQAAYAAGTHLQASRSRLSAIVFTHKAPEDVVDAIDQEAQALIREVVLKQFPEHAFAGDEAGADAAALLNDGRPHWIVESINGVTNYLRGYPQYAVSIALVESGEPQLGVVYDPCRNEFFGAIRGRGAVLNGEALRCALPRAAIEAVAATVFPTPGSPRMATYIAEFGRVVRAFGGVRRSGSMALELAYLAAGRIDTFWAHDLSTWEAAASIVLLRESGALIHSRDGKPLLASQSVLACTPTLFEPFLSLLAEP
jgi:myo-inositol-1(or 4)-monophosphatase